MENRKKIAVVTGTRAEYGILSSVITAIEAKKKLRLALVVAGMHLSHEFGYTISEIEKDGHKIDAQIHMLSDDDSLGAMARSIGQGIMEMTQAWEQMGPDYIVILGDRVEPLAAAISGAYMNIAIAHIHGGDVTGNVDDSARQAITKFAHIHFPATESSAKRIIEIGEEKWRIHVVGSPALDNINDSLIPADILVKKYGLDLSGPLLLVVQHPVTSQLEDAPRQMRETLEAVVELKLPVILIYPNSDAGGRKMIEVIGEYGDCPFIHSYKSIPRQDYLSLMKTASVIVGNSSSAIIESPSFNLPVVNVGIRQEGRERGENIIDVDHDRRKIVRAINKGLSDESFLTQVKECKNPYGDGKAGLRIADILSRTAVTSELIRK